MVFLFFTQAGWTAGPCRIFLNFKLQSDLSDVLHFKIKTGSVFLVALNFQFSQKMQLNTEDIWQFLCPISNSVLDDPVIAEDGITYNRQSIVKWFSSCSERGLPTTSPITRNVVGTDIKDVKTKKRPLAKSDEPSFASDIEGVASIHELRAVFSELDPLRDVLAQTLKGWQPPQLVVLGQENTGKSSILERLAMIPIFPRDNEMCTRMPIHVRLRNQEVAEAPTLTVFNVNTNKVEEGPYMIPSQSGAIDVREKMQEIVARENAQLTGVSTQRIIILHVEGPHVPSIDLVDMPGLLAAPQELREKTRALVERHIRAHGAYSMYLAVVPGAVAPNNSVVMDLVQAHGLQPKTFGVFTMCDEVPPRECARFKRRLERPPPDGTGGIALEPHGWVATMNRPVDQEANGFARLRAQADAEAGFFRAAMPELEAAGLATCGALMARLKVMFLDYVQGTWAPATFRMLDDARSAAAVDDALLGLPAFPGQGKDADTEAARTAAAAAANTAFENAWPKGTQLCCDEVLGPLRTKLQKLLGEPLQGLAPAAAEARLTAQKEAVLLAVQAGALDWKTRWAALLRAALEAPPSPPAANSPAARDALLASPPFNLTRFPMSV
jgi:GTP-binding protein EngB required for normal cell division